MMVVYSQYEENSSMRKTRIAAKYSALWGSVPLKLPLEDRSLTLYPRPYRWLAGDHSGRPQTYEEALVHPLFPKYKG